MHQELQPEFWLEKYGDYLFSFAMLKTGNREIAEDLVQETLLAAFKNAGSFSGTSNEKTWLTAILKNKVIDHYRKKDVLKNSADYLDQTSDSFYGNFFETQTEKKGHWLPDSAPGFWETSADGSLNQREFTSILEACISKMPPRFIPVFVAKYLDDEGAEKICKDYDLTSSNYWVILHRAKVLMRSCLEKNWFVR